MKNYSVLVGEDKCSFQVIQHRIGLIQCKEVTNQTFWFLELFLNVLQAIAICGLWKNLFIPNCTRKIMWLPIQTLAQKYYKQWFWEKNIDWILLKRFFLAFFKWFCFKWPFTLVSDHFLYSHHLNVWFRGDIVGRN